MLTKSVHFEHWSEFPKSQWRWKNFTPREMRCRGTEKLLIVPEFMDQLQSLRDGLGFALPVSSGFRTPGYNEKVSSTGRDGPHTTGHAVDILIYGKEAYELIADATTYGFPGLGMKQHGPYEERFVHLDDLDEVPRRPRPWPWTYK
ncbi:MAG: D-Ala-D-Ala carboxypeptidase family metallohydrolase [Acidobacteriota bacterium]